jgi:hypothetical protein
MHRLLAALIASGIVAPIDAQPVLQRFVPLVEWEDTAATCVEFIAGVRDGERGYSLRFGTSDSSNRVVSAVWDSTGALRRYSDARADLRPRFIAGDQLGSHTIIAIDFDRQIALMSNIERGQDRGNVLIAASDAMEASMLGPPRRLLARLQQQCGAPNSK